MSGLTDSTQVVMGTVLVVAGAIVFVFVVMRVIVFIQRMWRE